MICGINLPGGKPCLENKWSCDRDGDRHLSSAPLVSNSFIAFHPFYKDGLIRLISPSFFLYILKTVGYRLLWPAWTIITECLN